MKYLVLNLVLATNSELSLWCNWTLVSQSKPAGRETSPGVTLNETHSEVKQNNSGQTEKVVQSINSNGWTITAV